MKVSNLTVEDLGKEDNYFMAKILNIKDVEYEFYHAFELGSNPGFYIFGYNVKKDFSKTPP